MQQAQRRACPFLHLIWLVQNKTFISLYKPCLSNIVPTWQESEMHGFLTAASPLLEVHVSKKTGEFQFHPSQLTWTFPWLHIDLDLPQWHLHSSSPQALLPVTMSVQRLFRVTLKWHQPASLALLSASHQGPWTYTCPVCLSILWSPSTKVKLLHIFPLSLGLLEKNSMSSSVLLYELNLHLNIFH